MINNDILRSLRYTLEYSDRQMIRIFAKNNYTVTEKELIAKMKREEEEGALFCEDEMLACFIDGLILELRGPRKDNRKPPAFSELTNNLVLKKLRIAFSLQEKDLIQILKMGGQPMSKGEITALFRKPTHRSYRECGNQVLRKFLRGLTEHFQQRNSK